MAKKKLKNYIFQKGIPKSGNNYPIAWNLLDKNVEYLKDEMLGYIKASSARDTAINLYPNLDTRITNNKEYWRQPCNGTTLLPEMCGGLYTKIDIKKAFVFF